MKPQPITRRAFIAYGGVAATAAGLDRRAAHARRSAAAGPGMEATAAEAGPLVRYNMQHLYGLDLADPAQAAAAYDEMRFVATLQGIVNRQAARLYLDFVFSDQFGALDIDGYWLAKLQAPGGMLAGTPVLPADSLDALLVTFRPWLRGAVVWDPSVPATANIASTVAGVEDLVAIRYDPSPGSLYSRYVAPPAAGQGPIVLPARVRLVAADGSSMFTGTGTIPGTSLASTGSAKCDAYLWAKARYLDTGRCDPGQLGYYLDSYWLTSPGHGLQAAVVMNHDYLVSRRGFVFDLSPWADEAPVDDPHQPLGADRSTLEAILASAYQGTGGQTTAIHGFIPWEYKYTNAVPGAGSHAPVATEWELAQIISAFNAYLDADAPGIDCMANASVYTHNPLEVPYPQNPPPSAADLRDAGFVAADGSVVPKRYVMFYVGDYDSAAWIYHVVPRLWEDPDRGSVPLNWAFNPNLAERISPALSYTRATATANDTFIAGDSGAGYLNPGMLEPPRQFSGLPSGLSAWERHCAASFRDWDISVTGFVIDGNAPGMSQDGLETYARFSAGGFAAQKIAPLGIVGSTPYLQMGADLSGTPGQAAGQIEGTLTGDTSASPLAPEFHSLRTILQSPAWHLQAMKQVQADLPAAEVAFVGAHTFYALLRQYLFDQVIASVSGPYAEVVPGQSVPVSIGLTSYRDQPADGTVSLSAPAGWAVSPPSVPFSLGGRQSGTVSIGLEAPATLPLGTRQQVTAVVTVGGQSRGYLFQTLAFSAGIETATVCTTLGAANSNHGLSQLEASGDGVTEPVTVAGMSGRETVQVVPGDLNMYFVIEPGIAFGGMYQATFTVQYADTGSNGWVLQYDSANTSAPVDGAYATAASVTNGNTGQWKVLTATVTDARFAGRENGGADFRIASASPVTVHSVTLVISGHGVQPVNLCGS